MDSAYNQLKVVFAALTRVDEAFRAARKKISNLPETKATYSFSNFDDYTIHGTNETGTSWEIEIAAMRNGTEVRWHLEIELTHSSGECELRAAAGFLGKYGPMELREIGPFPIAELGSLNLHLDRTLEELFADLGGDCQAAIDANRKEMEAFRRARAKTNSEQDVDLNG
jgi:hypothetical protein